MKRKAVIVMLVFGAITLKSCGSVTFNMSGASVGNARTFQVVTFDNRADIVNPRLSAEITDALKDKVQGSTSLKMVTGGADVMFEGEITGYNVQPQQVTAASVAARDRLTITVRVRFTNELEPDKSYDRSFSRFQEFTGGSSLSAVEAQLVSDILEELMEDIFNEAFSSW